MINQTQFRKDLAFIAEQLDDGSEEVDEKGMNRITRKLRFRLRIPASAYKDFMEYPVEALGLGIRTERGCAKLGIETVQDVIDEWDKLTVSPGTYKGKTGEGNGLGRVSVRELKTRVMEYYYEELSPEQRVRFWKEAITSIREP